MPLPLPDDPEVTLSHVALLAAPHEHPVPAVTETVNEPPLDATVRLVEPSV